MQMSIQLKKQEHNFVPHHREVLKNNHWVDSIEYKFDGQTYHKVTYVGTFEDDKLPTCDADLYR